MKLVMPLLCLTLLSCLHQDKDHEDGPILYNEPIEHLDDRWIFSTARINRIDLKIEPHEMELLRANRRFSYPRTKVKGLASIDDELIGDIGVRIRGGLGSFQHIDDKPKLELDFNEFSGDRFYGLESLSLNNLLDCSMIRESVAFAAYRHLNIPASRTGFAQLYINEQDYGLYLVVESQDDRWLRANFSDGSGRFYDGKYVFAGFVPKLVDFGRNRDDWFDLEEGEENNFKEITQISDAVLRSDEINQLDDELWSLVDWVKILTLLRVEQWTGNTDGYNVPNNYRVYFEPDQPMVMSPWDLDGAFLVGSPDELNPEAL